MAYENGLNTVAIEQFSLIFENEYQQVKEKLAGTTNMVTGVIGENHIEKFAAPFDLHSRGAYGSDIPRTIVQYEPILIPLEDHIALVASDIFEQALVNASEMQNFARQSAWALARKQDQMKLNAMIASSPDNTVTAGTGLNLAALQDAKEALDNAESPENDRYIVGTYSQQKQLLGETATTSVDFNTQRTLVLGQIESFYGFKFIWFSTGMSLGGLPITGGVRKCYAFQKDSITTAYSIMPSVSRDWNPLNQTNIVVPKFRAGSKVVRNNGIVLINSTES